MTITADAPTSLPNWLALSGAERREIVQPLWFAGLSASQIAISHFSNATRNGVIGVVARSGWKRSMPKPPPNSKPGPRPRMAVIGSRSINPSKIIKPAKQKPEREPTSPSYWIDHDRPPLHGTAPIRLIDLPSRDTGVACRFPVAGGYCGQDPGGDEHRYCEAHRKLMYRQVKDEDE